MFGQYLQQARSILAPLFNDTVAIYRRSREENTENLRTVTTFTVDQQYRCLFQRGSIIKVPGFDNVIQGGQPNSYEFYDAYYTIKTLYPLNIVRGDILVVSDGRAFESRWPDTYDQTESYLYRYVVTPAFDFAMPDPNDTGPVYPTHLTWDDVLSAHISWDDVVDHHDTWSEGS